jgi:hypothetical protein
MASADSAALRAKYKRLNADMPAIVFRRARGETDARLAEEYGVHRTTMQKRIAQYVVVSRRKASYDGLMAFIELAGPATSADDMRKLVPLIRPLQTVAEGC